MSANLAEQVNQLQETVDRLRGELASLQEQYRLNTVARRSAEAQYRSIFENATQGIFQVTPDGRCISANPALAQIAGYDSPAELMQSLTQVEQQLYVEGDRHQEFLRLLHEQRSVTKLESQIYRKDGTVIWISESARAVCDEAGNPLYYEGFVEDITERKQAEQHREHTLSLLQATLEATIDGILVVGFDCSVPVYNQKFVQMWDLPETLLPQEWAEERLQFLAQQTKDPQAFLERIQEIKSRYHAQAVLDYVEMKDGRIFERYSQPQWQGQQIIGRIWSFRDITERKRAEEALRRSELKYRNLFENSQVGIGRTRLEDGLFLEANQRFAEMLGFESVMDLAGNFYSIDFYANREDRQQILAQLQHSPEIRNYELPLRLPNGKVLWSLISMRLNLEEDCIDFVITDINARKRAEETLKQQQEFLRTVLDTDPNIIFVKDWNGKYLLANKAAAEFYGMTVDELVGKYDRDFHPDQEAVKRFLHENRYVIETGEGIFIPEEKITLDDRDEWLQWQKRPLRLPGSNAYSVLGIGVNITERKRAEIALRESEERYASLMAAAPVSIFRMDRLGNCLFVNDRWCAMTEVGVEGATGTLWLNQVHPDDRDRVVGVWQACIERQQSGQIEFRFVRPGGEVIWVMGQGVPETDAEGNVTGYVGTITDISDRKRLEEELRQSQQFLDTVINSVPIALFAKDVRNDFRYVLINKSAERILGFAAEEGIGRTDAELVTSDKVQLHYQEDLAAIEGGTLLELPEHWIDRGGESILVRGWKRPLIDAAGRTTHLLGITEDITDRWHQEQALRLIVEGTASKTGEEFFQSCVRYLAEVLRMRYALVTEFVAGSTSRVRTLAVQCGEVAVCQNFEYDLEGTPCEQVLQGQICCYTAGLHDRFPEGIAALDAHLESYLGMPLLDSAGVVLGHIAVVDDKPMQDDRGRELILRIFAARAGAELERQQADQALQASEAQNRAIVTAIPDLIIRMNRQGIYLDYIPPKDFAALFKKETIVGQQVFDGLPMDVATGLLRCIERTLDTGEPQVFEHQLVVDGELSDFEGRFAVSGEDEVLIMVRDISDRKRAQAQLKAQKDFLQQVIDVVPSAIFVKDTEGRLLTINQAGEVIYNIAAEAWLGKTDYDLGIDRDQVDEFLVINQEVMETREPKIIPAQFIQTPGGEGGWYRTIISPFIDSTGQVQGIIGSAANITDMKHTEEALRQAKESAESANRAKSVFLANMSHELRTPLNAILGFAQLMERDRSLTDQQRNFLATINRGGEHLLNLINDVLEMSKIEAGRITLNPAAFDLRQLLHTLQEMFQMRSQEKQLSLQFDIAENVPQYVLTDEGKLRQVLINLISNAVKFTERGQIDLRANYLSGETSVHTLLFEVEDTGRGIAPEDLDKLFQPFVQSVSGSHSPDGTGLGLAISRQFVRLMGGEIEASSTVGVGSRFRFHIQMAPVSGDAVQPAPIDRKVLKLAPHQPIYRILVVDDRQENRDLVAQLLQAVGFETRTAIDGKEAIVLWQSWQPHLIWMDMRMPVMDGYEATRRIRALEREWMSGRVDEWMSERDDKQMETSEDSKIVLNSSPTHLPIYPSTHPPIHPSTHPPIHPSTKIIALTASAFEEQRSNILAAGCDDMVRKPFREVILFEKMAEHLGVTYLYEAEGNSGMQPSPIAVALTRESLTLMPPEWIADLKEAAIAVDGDRLRQLIAEIPPTQTQLAEGLNHWVQQFCFDEILELL
ncbi:PAS domain S-box protein [Leptolyngbya ohadii]|uniref:PAS domain S-box protein n=1 Tax=Leptolyngbya ohadii TaxID=1962290 RepID=UPI000B5A20A1|nr:PAS domain S-box protein [Leptolyngbya ohadii]